jgi:eukaryotic-like serine/threonine-protein kinase
MGDPVLKKFGKYFLLDRIGEGGMAEIFRARLAVGDASHRLLVIKRVHASASQNADFAGMFRSEIQVTMRFTHPNIVQLYESGEENGQAFIAMEWVDGRNLRQIQTKLATMRERTPIEVSCYIAEQAASGLHYAHTFRDRISGQPLKVVHRDVSPQNIIVSFDGNVKVIDFGVAKATTNSDATRAGVIKGKLSYLSPEQVTGDDVDAQTDVFALGIVLWESLTGKRLFLADGENDFKVLKMIEACGSVVRPPSEFNSAIPRELDLIVLQALAREKTRRYRSAEEFSKALRRFVATNYPEVAASEIAHYVKRVFADSIVEDRRLLQELNAEATQLIRLVEPAPAAVEARPFTTTQTNAGTTMANLGVRFQKDELKVADRIEVAGRVTPTFKQVTARPSATTASHQSQADSRPSRSVRRQALSFDRSDRETSGLAKFASFFFVVGGVAAGVWYLNHAGYVKFPGVNSVDPSAQSEEPAAVEPVGKQAALIIRTIPDLDSLRTNIYVNRDLLPPGDRKTMVRVGAPIVIVVERPGFVTFRKEFTLNEGDLSEGAWEEQVRLEPMTYGRLSVSTDPPIADVSIRSVDRAPAAGSKPWVMRAPFEGQKVPAGRYELVFSNQALGMSATRQITVREGSDQKINVQLKLDR